MTFIHEIEEFFFLARNLRILSWGIIEIRNLFPATGWQILWISQFLLALISKTCSFSLYSTQSLWFSLRLTDKIFQRPINEFPNIFPQLTVKHFSNNWFTICKILFLFLLQLMDVVLNSPPPPPPTTEKGNKQKR